MGVYIKGIRMPDNCDVCRFGDWSNLHQTACCKLKDYRPCFSDYSKEYRTQRSTICPLVALPEKYGHTEADAETRLMSLEPERKKGRWIVIEKGCKLTSYKCSECGRYITDDTGYDVKKDYPFCHCGADMRGEQNEKND